MAARNPESMNQPPAVAPSRSMSRLSKILSQEGLRPDKRFSQNFLVNQGALDAIVKASGASKESAVVEVGAGLGNLTELLARAAAHVTDVELDRKFQPIHERYLGALPNLRFAYGDFLQLPLASLFPDGFTGERIVVGNIPYSITAKILMKLLAEHEQFQRAYVLMQREVADRLRAEPGTKRYSVLTAKLRCAFDMRARFRITGGSFLPAPKVESTLLELAPAADPVAVAPEEREAFFSMLDGAFGQRRKTLPNSLSHSSGGQWPREAVAQALEELGMSPAVRAEELRPVEFLRLFHRLRETVGEARFTLRQRQVS